MAKKKSKSLASSMIRAVASKRRAKEENPKSDKSILAFGDSVVTDALVLALPAVSGYGAVRVMGRVAKMQLGMRFPRFAKHVGPLGSLLTLSLLWLLASKWKRIEKYKMPLVIGGIVGVAQSFMQSYLPGLAWLFDSTGDTVPAAKPQVQKPPPSMLYFPSEEATNDDDEAETVTAVTDDEDADLKTGIFSPN